MNERLSSYISDFFIILILIYGAYGCIGTTIPNLKSPIAFKSNSKVIVFTTDRKVICAEMNFNSVNNEKEIFATYEFERENLIHYFGSFYNIDSNNLPFGIRYYPNAKQVWLLKLKLLESNYENQVFFGNTFSDFTHEIFQFDLNNDLLVQGVKFKRIELSVYELDLINRFEKSSKKEWYDNKMV